MRDPRRERPGPRAGTDPVLVSPGTLAAVDVYVWLTYFQFSSVQRRLDERVDSIIEDAALTADSDLLGLGLGLGFKGQG